MSQSPTENMPNNVQNAHTMSISDIADELKIDTTKGLSHEEAAQRLKTFGLNQLAEAKRESAIVLFLRQLVNPLLVILGAGAAISGYTGHWVDAIAIIAIIFINATISFVQEFKAEQSIAALSKMAAPLATVMRGAKWTEIEAKELVPGDILRIKAGDILPADVRLLDTYQLHAEEAALTGESEPVEKSCHTTIDEEAPLAERFNMGFSSTLITSGTGIGIVTATAMDTEVGHIAKLMNAAKQPKTPLQERIEGLSKILIAAALLVVAIIIGIGLANGMDTFEMLSTAISLSVAAIPEGMPTIVTIVLTIGSQAMARKNALVRQLNSVETLGTTSVICSDKTGTLTQNQMQVMRLWSAGKLWSVSGEGFNPKGQFIGTDGLSAKGDDETDLWLTLAISAYCNEAKLIESDGRPAIQGNPTEGALVVAAAKLGITRAELKEGQFKTLSTFPFDSNRKMMSMVVQTPEGKRILIAKGAPDVVIGKSTQVQIDGQSTPFTSEHTASIDRVIEEFGESALRTLAVAYRHLEEDEDIATLTVDDAEQNLVLLAIHGIIDPPRPQVPKAVSEAAKAGIRTVMITGDHVSTATAIAEQIGIKEDDDQSVHTGVDVDGYSDKKLARICKNAAVFARVTPEHKLRIVNAMQNNGEVAAMTGDGVNDAPALRAADIGVAMGIAGTSVAKESASLVLLDDNFATIVTAVREGRRIYDNLLKFIRQALTANVAEVSAILFAFLLLGAEPLLTLTPLMILWINLVSDGMPALTLGLEPAEPNVMRRPPRSRYHRLFSNGLGARILLRGLALGGLTYYLFDFTLQMGHTLQYAQTVAFATLIFAQLWHIFDARSSTSLFRKNPFGNKSLLLAVFASAALSLLVIYTPYGNFILGTEPLEFTKLFIVIALASLPTLGLSAIKEIFEIKSL